jgi:5-methylcytosine-specific restriction endonuclease McrBC GTP-binding regulatory subunit McrB
MSQEIKEIFASLIKWTSFTATDKRETDTDKSSTINKPNRVWFKSCTDNLSFYISLIYFEKFDLVNSDIGKCYQFINRNGTFSLDDNCLKLQSKAIYDIYECTYHQKIIFGPPGTGKSYSVDAIAKNELGIKEPACRIQTVFHPEYTYGDFIAKLMPLTVGTSVQYKVVAGHFIKALAQALKEPTQSVLLQIDEINRGNCAAIFGDIFQLLDRDSCGQSSYKVHLSELAMTALEQEVGINAEELLKEVKEQGAYIPANLSIVATMNTSDESVYFMDSAFKRRWQFEYIDADHGVCDTANESQVKACVKYKNNGTDCKITWNCLRRSINLFMIENAKTIRGIEDKQIGLWFVKASGNKILDEDIQYKLMHYLWDNVFARDKRPLRELLGKNETELATFGQFVKLKDEFVTKVLAKCPGEEPECTQTETA